MGPIMDESDGAEPNNGVPYRTVRVDDASEAKLREMAEQWRISPGEVIGRLLKGHVSPQVLTVSDKTYADLELLGQAWDVTLNQVIRRLLRQAAADGVLPVFTVLSRDPIGVYTLHQGIRVEGVYDPVMRSVEITTKPMAKRCKSPSGAAKAVMLALSPGVSFTRNGWDFWRITGSDEPLQSIRFLPVAT